MQTDFNSHASRLRLGLRLGLRTRLRPLVAACAVVAASGAQADDPNPYYLGVSQAFTHDSNVFRVPTGVEGDTYSSTGLLAGIDQPFGRQHFSASGNVRENRFNNLDQLNNTSYGLTAGLDWSTVERLSGNLNAQVNQNLANYGATNQVALTTKNIETSELLQAKVRWGLVSLVSLEGGLSHQQIRYSATEYNQYETNQDSASLGVVYRPSGLLTLGAALRHDRGKYPQITLASGADYGYTGNDLDLTANWSATGQSTLVGRVSFGRQRYNDAAQRDTSGTTGALSWNYKPTGKLTFDTSLTRDTGQDSTFQSLLLNGNPLTAIGDNSRITTSLSVTADYAITSKIKLEAVGRYSHRSLVDTLNGGGLGGSVEGGDDIKLFSLGATYAPARNWLVACNVARDSRSVTDTTPVSLSYPYNAHTASCSAQFTLQ